MYVCTDGWMDVGQISSTSKDKPSFSNENAMTDFRQTWYVGSGGTSTTHVVCHHWVRIFNILFAYLFWLGNDKKVKYPEFCMGYIDETWYVGSDGHNIQSSVWATLMKLGMWVVMGTSTTHVICHHHMHIFSTSFAYLFWLANKKNQISRVLYGQHWWNLVFG